MTGKRNELEKDAAFSTALDQAVKEFTKNRRVEARTAEELTFQTFRRAGVCGVGWDALHSALRRRYSGKNRNKIPN